MSESVCVYCGELKGEKMGCCGENHFEERQEEVEACTDIYRLPDFLRNQENLAREIAAKENLRLASQDPVSFAARLWCPTHKLYLKQNCPSCKCGYILSVGTAAPPVAQGMVCRLCGTTLKACHGYLTRVNDKGVSGIWECRPHCDVKISQENAVLLAIKGDKDD